MTRPSPHPRPAPAPAEPSLEQLAAFGRWVLAMHQPKDVQAGMVAMPECSCGSALVLCPYRSAANRYLGPPGR